MTLKNSSIQRVKYGKIIKCGGIIKATLEYPKADRNTLFCKYVIFEPPRLHLKWLTYICSHSTFLVANGYHARIQEFSSGGVQVSLDNVFFFFFFSLFLVLSLFNRSQMVNFKEIYHFSRFQRGSNIFQGGSNFFHGGSNCLFPIETHITCDFPGGVPTPCPPSGSALGYNG